MKYTLELTEAQAQVVVKALDAWSRIGMGQIGMAVTDHPDVSRRVFLDSDNSLSLFDISDSLDSLAKDQIFTELEGNSFHGILSEDIDEQNRVAYDIQQVVRHRLAWDNHKQGESTMRVSFDRPMRTSEEELPKMGRKE